MSDAEQVWVLNWQHLEDHAVMERIEWLRDNLVAGTDWGVCNDPRICVLKTESAGVMYRMRWFDGSQSSFDPYRSDSVLRRFLVKPTDEEAAAQ
jgi:hypothetical protein